MKVINSEKGLSKSIDVVKIWNNREVINLNLQQKTLKNFQDFAVEFKNMLTRCSRKVLDDSYKKG